MLLNHIAAILIFSGPLFYAGVWLAVDPAGIAELAAFLMRLAGKLVSAFGGPPLEPEAAAALHSLRLQKRLRLAGLALVLFAIVA